MRLEHRDGGDKINSYFPNPLSLLSVRRSIDLTLTLSESLVHYLPDVHGKEGLWNWRVQARITVYALAMLSSTKCKQFWTAK